MLQETIRLLKSLTNQGRSKIKGYYLGPVIFTPIASSITHDLSSFPLPGGDTVYVLTLENQSAWDSTACAGYGQDFHLEEKPLFSFTFVYHVISYQVVSKNWYLSNA